MNVSETEDEKQPPSRPAPDGTVTSKAIPAGTLNGLLSMAESIRQNARFVEHLYEQFGKANALFASYNPPVLAEMWRIADIVDTRRRSAGLDKLVGSPAFHLKPPVIDISPIQDALAASAKIVRLAIPGIEISKDVAKRIQAMTDGLAQMTRDLTANIVAVSMVAFQNSTLGLFDRLSDSIKTHEEAATAFQTAGWPIAPSMPSELRQRVSALHSQGKTRYVSRAIMGYYRQNHYRRLTEMVQSWSDHPLFRPRMHILRDALEAHISQKYTLSVPALMPQIEGILNEYVSVNQLPARFGKVKQVYKAAIGDPEDYPLHTWVIASTLLFQLEHSTYADTDFPKELAKPPHRRRFTRHSLSHGVALGYDRPAHSLRLFLLLDAISALCPPK